jgi:ribosomal protein S17
MSTSFKRTLTGEVVSDKTSKTIVVKVERKTMHPKYNKFVTTSKKYSKLKRWELVSIQK